MRKGLYTTALLFSLLSVNSAVQAGDQMASNRFVLPDLACLFLGQCDEYEKVTAERDGASGGRTPPKGFTVTTTQRGGGAPSVSPGSKYERGGATGGRTPPKT